MADSKPAAPENKDKQVCTITQELFAKCHGMRRIQVEDLAPCDFNRFGDALKGSRVMEIISLLLVELGFADYKYECCWAVCPPDQGGFKLAELANKNARLDPLLPHRDRKTYYGTFRKSHLACALLIIKLGTYKWPDTDPLRSGYINADKANPALKQTLKEGMNCKTWSHEDVYADLENYKLLMASDNWEADEQMGDDELSVINRLCECINTAPAGNGLTKEQVVIRKVKTMVSTAWKDNELISLLDYAKASSPQVLEILRIFQRLTTDPTLFNVPIKHFKDVTDNFSIEFQWVRCTFTCAMYGACRLKETKLAGGRGKKYPLLFRKLI